MKNTFDTLFDCIHAAAAEKQAAPDIRHDPVAAVEIALRIRHDGAVTHPVSNRWSDPVDGKRATKAAFLRLAGLAAVVLQSVDARAADCDRAIADRLARLPYAIERTLDTGRLNDGTPLRSAADAWWLARDAFIGSMRPLIVADSERQRKQAARYAERAMHAAVVGAWMLDEIE